MREQLAEKVYAWLCKPEEERIIYELIDETNKVICEEIEKVENPYPHFHGESLVHGSSSEAFESCRQKILNLLSTSSK